MQSDCSTLTIFLSSSINYKNKNTCAATETISLALLLTVAHLHFAGINADLYLLPEDVYGGDNVENKCYDTADYAAQKGLQNISPCQYGEAPTWHSVHSQSSQTLLCTLQGHRFTFRTRIFISRIPVCWPKWRDSSRTGICTRHTSRFSR